MIKVLQTKITIDNDQVRNAVSNDRATLPSLARIAEGQFVYMPDEPVDKGEDRVDNNGGQTTEEEIFDVLCEYAAHRSLPQVGEGHNVQYAVRWYGYIPEEDTVEAPEHINEPSVTRSWHATEKNDAVQQQCGQAHCDRGRKVSKKRTLTNNIEDEISRKDQWFVKS